MAAPSAAWLCPCLPPSPPGRGAGGVGFLWCTGGWDLGRQSLGRQEVETKVRDSSQGSREVGASPRMLGGRGHAPLPQKDEEAHSPGALRGSAARALTLTRATFWLSVRVEPEGSWFSPDGNGGGGDGSSVTATSPRSGNRGRVDALRVAGALRGRAVCGQLEAAVVACGLFPPFINPARSTDGGRG